MDPRERAAMLVEALPYIQRFAGKTVVIKYGGAAQVERELHAPFAQDVVLLKYVGINVVVVHGGGPQIGDLLKRIGKATEFIEGLRVTDEETVGVVEMVLSGSINKGIVRLINRHGGAAVGLSGSDAGLTRARKLTLSRKNAEGADEVVDLGHVGEVVEVSPGIIHHLTRAHYIPVIAPLGVDDDGKVYNINADSAAGAIAGALAAEKFILLTDVPGILGKEGKLISTLRSGDVQRLREEGVIRGGMIPKVEACLEALASGVTKTHIVDGRVPHAVLLEVFTDEGVGTQIVR
ncbi:MAG: acetylglutamate kinase [Nitrospinota bacterium]